MMGFFSVISAAHAPITHRMAGQPVHGRAGSSVGWWAHHLVLSLVGSMPTLVALLAGGAVLAWAVRLWSRRHFALSGCWFEVALGERVSRSGVEAALRTLAHGLPRRWFTASPWVGIAVAAGGDGARCGLFVSGGVAAGQVRAAFEQALGGASIEQVEGPPFPVQPVGPGRRCGVACMAASGSRFLPLRTEHGGADPAGQVLAALAAQTAEEGGVVELVLQAPSRSVRSRARGQARRLRSGRGSTGGPLLGGAGSFLDGMVEAFFANGRGVQRHEPRGPVDPLMVEQARAIELKAGQPLLAASLRIGAWASGRRAVRGRLSGVVAALGPYHDLGGLRRGRELFGWRRLAGCVPSWRAPLIFTCAETAALIPIPEQAAVSPLAFPEAASRRLAPAAGAPVDGLLLGRGDRSGFDRPIRVEPVALLQHTHVLGPTGRGKSTLLLNMTLEAIKAGMGGMVLDPTGELAGLILPRIPTGRAAKVDLLDLGDTVFPPALNLLACRPGEEDAHVQAICGIFARLYSRYWGPRTEDVFRSALSTLLIGRDVNGVPPTLADVLDLLSRPAERARYRSDGDPVALDQFWAQWQALSETARAQALAPLANKLRGLLGQRMAANMLCQPGSPDFEMLVGRGRWLIVSAPPGIGEDTADLIGSVLIYRAWQAARRLGPLAQSNRPPFLCVVDECHRFCRMPMGPALAQARGYGLGFVLAHQHLGQLGDRELSEAVEANTQTKLCFALEPTDARRMAAHYAPRLDDYDLQHLGAHTIAARVLHQGRQLPAATARTLPPTSHVNEESERAIRQRAHGHSRRREQVEAQIRKRYGQSIEPPPAGRADAEAPPAGAGAGAPSGPPFGPPSGGAARVAEIAHHDSDPGRWPIPDGEQQFPSDSSWGAMK